MRYASAAALRAAVDRRLLQQANESSVDIGRLRRRIVFERLLVRFALAGGERWVLKGGVAVEVRLTDRARATRDLDMAVRGVAADGLRIRDLLGAPSPVWRANLDGHLAGRTFDRVVADIVAGTSDVERVERLSLPGTLSFAGLAPVEILAVDLHQHFAEKLHAMVRRYGDRQSTRVKDLADLVLFVEAGLEPTGDLARVVTEVFASRGDHPPDDLPDPPAGWDARYEELARELSLPYPTVASAMAALREFWSRALRYWRHHAESC